MSRSGPARARAERRIKAAAHSQHARADATVPAEVERVDDVGQAVLHQDRSHLAIPVERRA